MGALDRHDATSLTAADAMTRDPLTVGPEDTLLAAWELLSRSRFRHLPVVDAAGRCIGVVDDRVVVVEVTGPPLRPRRLVADVMRPYVRCALPTAPLREVAQTMHEGRITAVPVVDASLRLVGIVTDSDVIRLVAAGELAGAPRPLPSLVVTER